MSNIKFDFKGKNVVITGAATGLGRATALEFAKAGANVAVCDFNEEKASETVKMAADFGIKAKFYPVDVRSIEQIEAARDAILKDFGTVDFLINNAGVGPKGSENMGPPLEKVSDEDWERLFSINTFGMIKMARAFLPTFREKKAGKIVNIASISAFLPGPMMPHYSASKSATINFTHSLSVEMGPYNVNVNCVNPGFIYTNIYSDGGALDVKAARKGQYDDCDTGEEVMNKMASQSAMRRPQKAEDIANAIMFLCSDEAREITGQLFNVDSGIVRR